MSDGPVSSSFRIDTRQVRDLARRYGQDADRDLRGELTIGFNDAITVARREANLLIRGGEASKLARASQQRVYESGRDIRAEANWDAARSPEGFPYAAAVDRGRKAFGPKTKKVLRFELNGRVVFAKRVGPAPAQNFTGRGLEQARPRIVAKIDGAVARWVSRMATS